MKRWKSYAKMLLCMAVGAVLGFSANMAVRGVGKRNLTDFVRGIQGWIQDQYLPLSVCLGILVLVVNVSGLLCARSLFKREQQVEEDEALEKLEQKVELCQGSIMTVTTVLVILALMLIGIGITENRRGLYGTLICFVVVLAAVAVQVVAK